MINHSYKQLQIARINSAGGAGGKSLQIKVSHSPIWLRPARPDWCLLIRRAFRELEFWCWNYVDTPRKNFSFTRISLRNKYRAPVFELIMVAVINLTRKEQKEFLALLFHGETLREWMKALWELFFGSRAATLKAISSLLRINIWLQVLSKLEIVCTRSPAARALFFGWRFFVREAARAASNQTQTFAESIVSFYLF